MSYSNYPFGAIPREAPALLAVPRRSPDSSDMTI
jgi:hypothetical protein